MFDKTQLLPYDTPNASAFALTQEQQIMSGSVQDTLGDFGAIDILDEPFISIL